MIGNGFQPPNSPFSQRYPHPKGFNSFPQPYYPQWRPTLSPMMGPSVLPINRAGNALPIDTVVKAPPANDDVQKKYPNLYARLANNQLIEDLKPNVRSTAKTVAQVARREPAKDSQLAELDDNAKRMGSLAIATLATLGLKQRILGVGEYVGFMSWFAAMAATPSVINNMVRLKTGIDLGQKYDSTYGERTNIFKDPNYLPLHILPQETMDKVAKRLNIPPGPNQRRETEEKMRQISVQTHTWWMLVAGPATPVISGLMADNLQGPATRGYNLMMRGIDNLRARRALTQTNDAQFEKLLTRSVNRLVGKLPESELTSWWKDFAENITQQTGLRNALTRKDVLDDGGIKLETKILNYLTHADAHGEQNGLKRSLTENRVKDTLAYLERQFSVEEVTDKNGKTSTEFKGKLGELRTNAQKYLQFFKTVLEDEKNSGKSKLSKESLEKRIALVEQQSAEVNKYITNAGSTVEHYQKAMKQAKWLFAKKFNPKASETLTDAAKQELAQVRAGIGKMLNTNLSDLLALRQQGQFKEFREIAGHAAPEIEEAINGGKHQIAYALTGASPQTHLMRALKDVKAHALWRNRIVYGLGFGMLAATGIYTTLFVGRDFKSKPQGGTASS